MTNPVPNDGRLPTSLICPPLADLVLASTDGTDFRFSEQIGRPLVVFFYPKDNTPGCTCEVQDFRDLHDDFEALDCVVRGVSRDGLKSHAGFIDKHGLPYPLLSDKDETACQIFDLIKDKIMYGKPARGLVRSTFLFDKKGDLVKSWRAVKVEGHAAEVLEAVRNLETSPDI